MTNNTHNSTNALSAAVIDTVPVYAAMNEYGVHSASLDRYPDRDLGIGYGRSSGYAAKTRRSYGESSAPAILRVG